MLHDRYYHAARSTEERLLAITSPNVRARAIHLEMAVRYDALVEAKADAPLQTIPGI